MSHVLEPGLAEGKKSGGAIAKRSWSVLSSWRDTHFIEYGKIWGAMAPPGPSSSTNPEKAWLLHDLCPTLVQLLVTIFSPRAALQFQKYESCC